MKMRVNKNNLICFFINIFLILICGFLGELINCDFVLLLLYLLPLLFIVLKHKVMFIKYLYFFIMNTWSILSVFAINNTNMYLTNLQETSYHTGAMFPLVLTETVSLYILLAVEQQYLIDKMEKYEYVNIKMGNQQKISYKLIGLTMLIATFLFLLEIVGNNYYSSGSSDRFYYEMTVNAISVSLYGYLLFAIPILSINAYKSGNRKIFISFVALYTIYIILVGGKFGPFIQLFYVICLSYLLLFYENKIRKHYWKIFSVITFIVILLLSFSLIQMSYENGSISLGLKQLYERVFSGQGDVWWGVYSKYSGTGNHINELTDEFGAFTSNGNQLSYNYGIYKMMNLIAPLSVLQRYAVKFAKFTMSTNASLYYYFTTTGLVIFKSVFALLQAFLVNKVIYNVRKCNGIESMMWVWLLIHFMSINSMSAFDLFFCQSAILCYVIIFGCYVKKKSIQIHSQQY